MTLSHYGHIQQMSGNVNLVWAF